MTDQALPTATLLASWLSAATMALLGVEYVALLWGFFGALFSLRLTPPETRVAAAVTILLSTLAGAALAGVIAAKIGGGKNEQIAAAFIVGAGAKLIVSALLEGVANRLRGGKE